MLGQSKYCCITVTGEEYETLVKNLMDMGFERQRVTEALSASFNNPDRAYEYLIGSIPADVMPAVPPTQGTLHLFLLRIPVLAKLTLFTYTVYFEYLLNYTCFLSKTLSIDIKHYYMVCVIYTKNLFKVFFAIPCAVKT